MDHTSHTAYNQAKQTPSLSSLLRILNGLCKSILAVFGFTCIITLIGITAVSNKVLMAVPIMCIIITFLGCVSLAIALKIKKYTKHSVDNPPECTGMIIKWPALASLVLLSMIFIDIIPILRLYKNGITDYPIYALLIHSMALLSGIIGLSLSLVFGLPGKQHTAPVQASRISWLSITMVILWAGLSVALLIFGNEFIKPPVYENDYETTNEEDLYTTIQHQTRNIDSSDFKQTAIVPTLICSVPEHKNIIWCATFQMVWDAFRKKCLNNDPLQIPKAAALASRLNKNIYPLNNIDTNDYYIKVGSTENVLQQITQDMKSRFPDTDQPVFDQIYDSIDAIIAYAYLQVNIDFAQPFFNRIRPLKFTSSNGTVSDVNAFSNICPTYHPNIKTLRKQVDILAYTEQGVFALDLDKNTSPYQIILACVPRMDTLQQTLDQAQQSIKKFTDKPDYTKLRILRKKDILIVPDIYYKITHNFKELEGKNLGNPGWEGNFIMKAYQMVDFTLSRKGMILKSEAAFIISSGIPNKPKITPRHFIFNRPFLIYVKKRGTNHEPFFVMWVDNAELLSHKKAAEPIQGE